LIDTATYSTVDAIASSKSVVDYALYAGATSSNALDVAAIARQFAGLKMYLNDTFTTLKLENMDDWSKHLEAWPAEW
jgi:carbamoyl-phosphate synthase/aspartate carbamoyltransferase/dihydroorotase